MIFTGVTSPYFLVVNNDYRNHRKILHQLLKYKNEHTLYETPKDWPQKPQRNETASARSEEQLCFDTLWENVPVHPHQLLSTWERGNRKWAFVTDLKHSRVNALPTVWTRVNPPQPQETCHTEHFGKPSFKTYRRVLSLCSAVNICWPTYRCLMIWRFWHS